MSFKKPPPTDHMVTCPICSVACTPANASRHRREQHPELVPPLRCRKTSVGSVTPSRSRSSSLESRRSDQSVPPPFDDSNTSTYGWMPVPVIRTPTSVMMEIAAVLVEQHDICSEGQLMDFVTREYPEMADVDLRSLVVGAIAGARQAAHWHFVHHQNRDPSDAAQRVMSSCAGRHLCFWGLGFPAVAPSTESPRVLTPGRNVNDAAPTATPDSTISGVQQFPVVRSLSLNLNEIQFPVPQGIACADFDLVRAAAIDAGIALPNLFPTAAAGAPQVVRDPSTGTSCDRLRLTSVGDLAARHSLVPTSTSTEPTLSATAFLPRDSSAGASSLPRAGDPLAGGIDRTSTAQGRQVTSIDSGSARARALLPEAGPATTTVRSGSAGPLMAAIVSTSATLTKQVTSSASTTSLGTTHRKPDLAALGRAANPREYWDDDDDSFDVLNVVANPSDVAAVNSDLPPTSRSDTRDFSSPRPLPDNYVIPKRSDRGNRPSGPSEEHRRDSSRAIRSIVSAIPSAAGSARTARTAELTPHRRLSPRRHRGSVIQRSRSRLREDSPADSPPRRLVLTGQALADYLRTSRRLSPRRPPGSPPRGKDSHGDPSRR
jgi:hypothetical protein